MTELVGDIVLTCTGGTPTPLGQVVPTANITVQLNTAVTSRQFSNGTSEALLLIDEPGSATNPNTPQIPCLTLGGCPILGTAGAGTYNGTPGHPNIFQGTPGPGPNTVTWNGMPIDAPGTAGFHIYRITNIRANANQLGLAGSLTPVPVSAFISTTPAFKIQPQTVVVGNVLPGLSVGSTSGSFQYCANFNANQLFSEITPGVPSPATFNTQWVENFVNAFKTAGSTPQNVPGKVYNTESGLTFPPSVGLPSGTGQADTGTVFQADFPNLPQGLQIQVPLTNALWDSTGAVAGSVATAPTGVVSGTTMTVTPSSLGDASVFFEVTERDPTSTGRLNLNVPFTLVGAPATVPANLETVVQFPSSQYPQNSLFAPGSSLLNNLPIFGRLSYWTTSPMQVPYLWPASVVPCTNSGNTLNVAGMPSPTFIGVGGTTSATGGSSERSPGAQPEAAPASGPSLIAPRVSNVGIVSTLLATSGITVTKDPSATWLNVGLSSTTTPATLFLSVNSAAPGPYSTTLQLSSPALPGTTLSVPVSYTVAEGPWFTGYGFANSASYVSDVVAPGEPFVIFGGDAFGPAALAGAAFGADGRLLSSLGNTSVLFDGVPAPLYYSVNNNGSGQVAGFAPFRLAMQAQTSVQVVYNGVASPPLSLFVLDTVPGLYTADASGGGQGSILNQDASINGVNNPESPGNLVVLYGGGAGQTSPPGRDGALAGVGAPLATLTLPVKVFIDGIAATDIPYAGPAPNEVEGVLQINVRIPAGVRHNAQVPVVVQIEDKQTQLGVTLATK
jgi:uncharacterized protein (TIGR03437 family)